MFVVNGDINLRTERVQLNEIFIMKVMNTVFWLPLRMNILKDIIQE